MTTLVRTIRSVSPFCTHELIAQPSVLINRFMINLRAAVSDDSVHTSGRREQSTLQFRRPTDRLGNIGGTLQEGWSNDSCDEENDDAGADEEGRRETNAEA